MQSNRTVLPRKDYQINALEGLHRPVEPASQTGQLPLQRQCPISSLMTSMGPKADLNAPDPPGLAILTEADPALNSIHFGKQNAKEKYPISILSTEVG